MKILVQFTILLVLVVAVSACDPNANGGSTGGGSSLQITAATLPNCPYNTNYLYALSATGGTAPYRWELASGTLPGKMELTQAGEVYGNPVLDYGASYPFRARVTDALGASAERDLVITVDAPPSPAYFGDPILTGHVFLLDASADMATVDAGQTESRLQLAIDDIVARIIYLTPFHDKIEIIAFDGAGLEPCFGNLQYRTSGTISMAQDFLATISAGGDSTLYSALKSASLDYGQELTYVYAYSGAAPGADAGAPGGSATYNDILTDFPGFWTNQIDADLVAIDMIGSGAHATFMQQLAALGGGTYQTLP